MNILNVLCLYLTPYHKLQCVCDKTFLSTYNLLLTPTQMLMHQILS